jgi:hypothetical protein
MLANDVRCTNRVRSNQGCSTQTRSQLSSSPCGWLPVLVDLIVIRLLFVDNRHIQEGGLCLRVDTSTVLAAVLTPSYLVVGTDPGDNQLTSTEAPGVENVPICAVQDST